MDPGRALVSPETLKQPPLHGSPSAGDTLACFPRYVNVAITAPWRSFYLFSLFDEAVQSFTLAIRPFRYVLSAYRAPPSDDGRAFGNRQEGRWRRRKPPQRGIGAVGPVRRIAKSHARNDGPHGENSKWRHCAGANTFIRRLSSRFRPDGAHAGPGIGLCRR